VESSCGHVDVELTVDVRSADFNDGLEAFAVLDVKFDDWKINYVTAIEQIYDADCLGECGVAADLDNHPVHCTRGIADVRLTTFDTLPTFDDEARVVDSLEVAEGDLAVLLFPGDRSIEFSYGEGSFVRFGGETAKAFGRISVRVLLYNAWTNGERSVTLRFHTACEEDIATTSVFTGYLSAQADAAPLIYPTDVPQTRIGRISVDSFKALRDRDEVDSLWIHAAGVYGRDWLSEATLYKINSAGTKNAIASIGTSDFVSENIWNVPHITPINVQLSAGEFLQWVCTYSSTANPPLSADGATSDADSIESGDNFFFNYGCDIGLVFSNSRCGSAYFNPDTLLPRDCLDPLFKPTDDTDTSDPLILVYDYNVFHGECGDGGQWSKHAYACTDLYDGGKCAFCVGRANNIESRTCMDRTEGLTCNEMFNSKERKTWCNMEFECPATSIAVPFGTLILAIVALLV